MEPGCPGKEEGEGEGGREGDSGGAEEGDGMTEDETATADCAAARPRHLPCCVAEDADAFVPLAPGQSADPPNSSSGGGWRDRPGEVAPGALEKSLRKVTPGALEKPPLGKPLWESRSRGSGKVTSGKVALGKSLTARWGSRSGNVAPTEHRATSS
eukprot:gene9541-biopygen10197